MKFTIHFHALLVAILSHLAFASAIERSSGLTARDDTNGTVSTPYGDVVSSFLPDGKHKFEFFTDSVLEVTALERDDGGKYSTWWHIPTEARNKDSRDQKGVTFYDVDGKEINMEDLNEGDDSLEKRVSKWKLAIKFAKLIAKYGKKAWTYISCVGTTPFWRCGDRVCNVK